MTQMRFLMLALLATIAWTGAASAYYFDIWPATADGCQNTYPDEGYAIGGEGNYRFTKSYHHFAYMGFGPATDPLNGDAGKSDGPDMIPQGHQKGGVNDSNDGVYLADWLADKKAFAASVYVRLSSSGYCDPYAADGLYQNDPVVIVGFRVANAGLFVDRGTDANGDPLAGGHGGCCAGYLAPLLDGGECAPGAWRMGRPTIDRGGVLGYSQNGAIGPSAAGVVREFYMFSYLDTVHPGEEVKVGSGGFGTLGFEGNSTNVPGMSGSSRWAFDYLLFKSDAMQVNTNNMTEADCTGYAGEEEPRDFAADGTIGEGWFAEHIDVCIVYNMAFDPETKGLVFSSRTSAVSPQINPSIWGRDQGGGMNGPYLAITATLLGDGPNNDGCADVVDLLDFVAAFGSAKGDANYDPEVDWNCDGYVDVVDLLTFVEQFGNCI